jgi:arylsulfatase
MAEAVKYHVLPIDDRLLERTNAKLMGRPTVIGDRTTVTFGEGMTGMGVDVFIDTRNKSFSINADVEVTTTSNGVIVCQGGKFGGFSLYIKNSKPSFTYNWLGLSEYTVASKQSLKPGKHTILYKFAYDGGGLGKGGTGSLFVDGTKVAEGRIAKTQPGIFSVDDLADVGTDDGTWVTNYGFSARFIGHIDKVTIDVGQAKLSKQDHNALEEAEENTANSEE